MSRPIWQERLQALRDKSFERRPRVVTGPMGPLVSTPDGDKLSFCSNDYLGLASHGGIARRLADAALAWGGGQAASRLVCGNTAAHERLEQALAGYMDAEDAVLFPSGYQANVGALTALTERGDAVFTDALVHASIVDGCRLSRAEVRVFRHRDAGHLAEQLRAAAGARLKLVVTDAVFSMDGDLAPLEEICRIATAEGAFVYLDEAHSLGVLGPDGKGLAAALHLSDRVAVRIGTLGKSFGLSGAFVAVDRDAAGLLRSRARSLLYTTAAPAALAEAALESLELVRNAHDRRARLKANIALFTRRAAEAGLPLLPSDTPIQPVPIGGADRAMAVSDALWQRGFFVQGMRPPTVAEGTSRLRVTLTAAHGEDQIEALVRALGEVLAATV